MLDYVFHIKTDIMSSSFIQNWAQNILYSFRILCLFTQLNVAGVWGYSVPNAFFLIKCALNNFPTLKVCIPNLFDGTVIFIM